MKSKTKYPVTHTEIDAMFRLAGLGTPTATEALSAGEFNTVYAVRTEQGKFVLKIASAADVLTYERGMMAAELSVYARMRAGGIRVPDILYVGKAGSVIDTDWFIMQYVNGHPLPLQKGPKAERDARWQRLGMDVGRLHSIPVEGCGYLQMGLRDSWGEAFCGMVEALIGDAARFGGRTRRGETLLRYARAMRGTLDRVSPVLVNFDIFDLNLLDDGGDRPVWIDPERSFFGDAIAEFVMLQLLTPLPKKRATLQGYRSVRPLVIGEEECARWALYTAYLALIMEVERASRYTKGQLKYWMNGWMAAVLYHRAFRLLKRYEKRL